MTIAFLGVNHRQARMDDIEAVYLNQDAKQEFLNEFCKNTFIKECVILATCNRFELYFESSDVQATAQKIMDHLAEVKSISKDKVVSILNHIEGDGVFEHLLRVTSGLDSMVFGENEILTQVKEAYDLSLTAARTGALFNKIFQTAVAVGKRVRAETGISRGSYSVSSIAVEAIREHNLDYFGQSIAVVGMGVMGRRCVKKLAALGHPDITVFNRTNAKAKLVSNEDGVTWKPFEELQDHISEFEIVISAVSSSSPILSEFEFQHPNSKTRLVVDLGLPRNVKESITRVPNMTLINVDGLRVIAEKNVGRRKAEEQKVFEIIHDEILRFKHWESMRRGDHV